MLLLLFEISVVVTNLFLVFSVTSSLVFPLYDLNVEFFPDIFLQLVQENYGKFMINARAWNSVHVLFLRRWINSKWSTAS